MVEPRPLVSLCVPTYRRAAFIGETLASALAQTVTDFEVIVVDDVSPDNTSEVVGRFADPRVRYLRNATNLGVPANLNYAMSLARGEFLVLLEDHDVLEPTYLAETLALMRRYPSVGFAATGLITIDESGQPLERYVPDLAEFVPGRLLLRRLLTRTDCPFTVTTMIRRSACDGVEPLFDSKYWWFADQFLWMRLAAKSDFGYVAKPLLRFRTREADHHLNDRLWESLLCLNRIHHDNWHLLHPRGGLAWIWDHVLYDVAKWKTAIGMRAGRVLRREPWTAEDARNLRGYLAGPGLWLVNAVSLVPRPFLATVRRVLARRAGTLRRVSAESPASHQPTVSPS